MIIMMHKIELECGNKVTIIVMHLLKIISVLNPYQPITFFSI